MDKRVCRCEIRLTQAEMAYLAECAKKAGTTVSNYVRNSIKSQVIQSAPSIDVPALIQEIRHVGININQIARTANSIGMVDAPQLRRELENLRAVEKHIVDTFTKGGA